MKTKMDAKEGSSEEGKQASAEERWNTDDEEARQRNKREKKT